MVIAGHRTSHTHPFLFIDSLQPGDEFYVYADGKYTYQVQGSVVVPGSDYNTIVAWTPQPTVTLYPPHPPRRSPTQRRYRPRRVPPRRRRASDPLRPGARRRAGDRRPRRRWRG